MSNSKAPNAVVVSAQRLQDLRDLCQPSNFNTTEQAHNALHDGISKLLNERNGVEIFPHRLMIADRFKVNKDSEEVWIVTDRIRESTINFSSSIVHDLEINSFITSKPDRLIVVTDTGSKDGYLNLDTGILYETIDGFDMTIDHVNKVYLISQL